MLDLNEEKFEALLALLDTKKYSDFIHLIDEMSPVDAAEFLEELPPKRFPVVFRLLKKDTAADIFAELDSEKQAELITAMTDREITLILNELFVDDAVDMIEEMPAGMVERIMKNATPETRTEINRFLSYPEDSAGSVMTSEFIDLKKNLTAKQAVERIRKIGLDKETIYVAYVTNSSRILEGVVPLKSLLFASPEDRIADIMNPNVIYASTHDDQESVARTISHYDLLALPIVDKEKRLVGIVTVDDALDVLETETTEDIERMAAIVPNDKPYMKTGVWESWKKRVPWLLLLMISATFTGTIIAHYETAIGTYAILTVFVPMLMSTGGNAGGQASSTIIRGLSVGDIEPKDVLRVICKELRIGLICGVTLAIATFAKVMLVDFRLQAQTVMENGTIQNNLIIATVIALTVCGAIVLSKMVGALLPLATKRIGLDPTVVANPFVTTVVDTVTLVVYFSIASAFLPL